MKKLIIIICIITIYVLGMIIGIKLFSNEMYLYMGNNIRWHYSDKKWENLENNIPYNNFMVYNTLENEYAGKYDIKYENENWYIKKKNYELFDKPAIMFKGNKKLNIISYQENYDLDNSEVKALLNHLNLDMNNYTGYYIDIDLDNDDEIERIYCLTNSEIIGINENIYYSLIYVKDGNQYIEVSLEKSNERFDTTYWISSIIDLNNDNKYELLVTKTDISQNEDKRDVIMYGLENNQYIKLIST